MKLFFFDTETTGTNPEIDRIIQFGGIYGIFDENKKVFTEKERINQYINVKINIPESALKIHGIKNDFLKDYGYIEDYIYEFLGYIKKADYVIGHNVTFDKNMIIAETKRLKLPFDFSKITRVDTMKTTANLVKIPAPERSNDKYKRPKLNELHKFLFGKEFEGAHDAMADIVATKNCFIELIKNYDIFDYLKEKKEEKKGANIVEKSAIKDDPFHGTVKKILGQHPCNGKFLYVKYGKNGPFIQLGDDDDENKVIVNLTSDKTAEDMWLGKAVRLVDFAKNEYCGVHDHDNNLGKTHEDDTRSIEKEFTFEGDIFKLNGYEEITESQANEIASFEGHFLCLDSLKRVSDENIKILSKFGGKYIDENSRNDIGLVKKDRKDHKAEGFEIVNREIPRIMKKDDDILITNGCQVSLGGLEYITDKQAEYLSKFNCTSLWLNGIKTLSNEQAASLSKFKGKYLYLGGLENLSYEQESYFKCFKGNFILLGTKRIRIHNQKFKKWFYE